MCYKYLVLLLLLLLLVVLTIYYAFIESIRFIYLHPYT